MAVPSGKVPIMQSVWAGLRFVRDRRVQLAPVVLLGAALTITVQGLLFAVMASPLGALLMGAVTLAVQGAVYALMLSIALNEGAAWRADIAGKVRRVLGAMTVTGFFLFIVFFVALLVGLIILGVTLTPYRADMEAAQGDPVATMALFERIYADNPWPSTILALVYIALWLLVTSRLYVVAPASVAENRILTFETWRWTQGAMVRIAAARVILLFPPAIALWSANMAATSWARTQAEPPAAVAFVLLILFSILAYVLLALEAGLSSFLYRGLRPSARAPTS